MQVVELLLSLFFVSTLGSLCCPASFPSGVAHDRGEEHDMGRLGLGVPEDVLAGARKTAAVSPTPSPKNVTGTACEKPLDGNIPSGTLSAGSARISLGIPRSVVDNCRRGLLPGESTLELDPEPDPELEPGPGLWLRAGWGSRLVPSWQGGARVTPERGGWKRRRRCNRAGLVPETGRPRLRSCCRNSDT